MKIKVVLILIAITVSSCHNQKVKQSKMKAKVIEKVVFKLNQGVSIAQAKAAMITLNSFISRQNGYISRTTATSDDNEFLDLVYWSDLLLAKQASDKAMKNEMVLEAFKVIDQRQLSFEYLEVFNNN